jgi:diguanylate cyclase (GGDEF)-like protein
MMAWRGEASALMHLGRPAEASSKAAAALKLAREQGNADEQIQMLRVLAQLHSSVDGTALHAGVDAKTELQLLLDALKIAANISGYIASPELLLQVASAYADSGDFRAAYEHTVAAETARSNKRTEEARKRALAMRVRNEVAQVRAEGELHRQLAATLRETTTTLETLGTIGREITACRDSQAVFSALHRNVHQMLDATFFAVYLLDLEQTALSTAFGIEAGVPLPLVITPIDSPTSMFARCVRERQEIAIDRNNGEDDPNRIPGTMAALSLLYFPLIVSERVLGAMSIQSPLPRAYQERERSIFRALCAYGAIALDNAAAYGAAEAAQRRADISLSELRRTQALLLEQNRQLERLAVTDQLTGLYNRLRLDQALEEERLRNVRFGTDFCVLLLDVDKFKSVNDTFGHPVGDQVLIGIAAVLRAGVRDVDVLGRWGGEEFLVVCPETSTDGALVLAEKLRAAINAQEFSMVGRKSASFGVAMFRSGEALPETIARADAALYKAKQDGRNRVEFCYT